MPAWSLHLVKKHWAMQLKKLKSAGKFVGAFILLALVLAGCKLNSNYNYPNRDYSYQSHPYRYYHHGHYRYYGHYSHYRYRYH